MKKKGKRAVKLITRKRTQRKKPKAPVNLAAMNEVLSRGVNDLLSILIVRRLGIKWTDLLQKFPPTESQK